MQWTVKEGHSDCVRNNREPSHAGGFKRNRNYRKEMEHLLDEANITCNKMPFQMIRNPHLSPAASASGTAAVTSRGMKKTIWTNSRSHCLMVKSRENKVKKPWKLCKKLTDKYPLNA